MRQFVELSKEYKAHIFIADLHALTTVKNREELEENTANVLLDYMAIGLDPKEVVLFKQSDVPQVTELAWIFECLVTVPYLERAHAYKDAVANGQEANAGLFNYPMLMAADILIQDADIVPVGQDQKQHVEYARDAAQKFNNAFGETFKEPEALIIGEVAVVPGTDGRKMSKSYGNTIPLFADDEELERAVMGIVTDSAGEKPENVYAMHALLRPIEELDPIYEENKGNYKVLKEMLLDDLKKFIEPMRDRRQALEEDKSAVVEVLKSGGKEAREKAEAKMAEVRKKAGLTLYS
jgi:tryptophanyl-tRNA synthetase